MQHTNQILWIYDVGETFFQHYLLDEGRTTTLDTFILTLWAFRQLLQNVNHLLQRPYLLRPTQRTCAVTILACLIRKCEFWSLILHLQIVGLHLQP
jgi:hypothetical protein